MSLDPQLIDKKIKTLLHEEGFTEFDFIERYTMEVVVPAICMTPECDTISETESECAEGYCSVCGANSVKSGLVLLGVQ